MSIASNKRSRGLALQSISSMSKILSRPAILIITNKVQYPLLNKWIISVATRKHLIKMKLELKLGILMKEKRQMKPN